MLHNLSKSSPASRVTVVARAPAVIVTAVARGEVIVTVVAAAKDAAAARRNANKTGSVNIISRFFGRRRMGRCLQPRSVYF
jgi:hypothetical protein